MWQSLMELDSNILFYVQDNLRNDALNDIVVWFTSLGNAGLIWVLLIAALIAYKGTRKEGLGCAISLVLCFIVVNLFLKNAVARVRPYDAMGALSYRCYRRGCYWNIMRGCNRYGYLSKTVQYK